MKGALVFKRNKKRGARVVEGGRLESGYTVKRIEGSNPFLSANKIGAPDFVGGIFIGSLQYLKEGFQSSVDSFRYSIAGSFTTALTIIINRTV